MAKRKIVLLPLYRKFVVDLKKGRRLQKNGKRIQERSIEGYKMLGDKLEEFSEKRCFPLYVRRIQNSRPAQLRENSRYWKDFYYQFSDFLYTEKNAHDNYVGGMFKMIRAFFNYLNDEKDLGVGNYHARFYKPSENIPVIVISPERLNFLIHDEEFYLSLTAAQAYYKDVMVFGCTVALRFSDLLQLGPEHIERTADHVYLVKRSQKTQFDTRVKLPPYAVKIIDKYKKRKRFFKKVAKPNFNTGLKRLCERAGWTEELPKTRNKRGIPEIIYRDKEKQLHYRFCDHVSSHTLRRTAITTMLRLGMEEVYVRRISGHAPHTGSFYRYVQFAGAFVDEQLDKVHSKLDAMNKGRRKKDWDVGGSRE